MAISLHSYTLDSAVGHFQRCLIRDVQQQQATVAYSLCWRMDLLSADLLHVCAWPAILQGMPVTMPAIISTASPVEERLRPWCKLTPSGEALPHKEWILFAIGTTIPIIMIETVYNPVVRHPIQGACATACHSVNRFTIRRTIPLATQASIATSGQWQPSNKVTSYKDKLGTLIDA